MAHPTPEFQLIRGGNFSCDELEGLKGGRGFRRAALASAITMPTQSRFRRIQPDYR
jgi:hypothetical protein